MTTNIRHTQTSKIGARAFVCGLAILSALFLTPPAAAQTFKLLYAFTGGADGGGPWGTPLYSGGQIYCTTFSGGGSAQAGTIFEYLITPPVGTALYAFAGEPYDGGAPMGGVITDGFGNFFGNTTQGGFLSKGMVWEFSENTESPVQIFNGSDGATPEGNLFMDVSGDFYGTTSQGGANDSGILWAYNGSIVELYSFGASQGDGVAPASGILFVYEPNSGDVVLYGTTTEGGAHDWGTVYSLNINTKTETVLYSFHGVKDGGTPVGGLVLSSNGYLYGTTSAGGNANGTAGNGVVFKLSLRTHQYSLVHTFTGADGSQPMATLLPDGKGDYYGTTYAGGAHGYGTVFEINAANTLTTLYNFTNGTDGAYPYAGLSMDSSGNLYGAATSGGQYHWGTLFEITP